MISILQSSKECASIYRESGNLLLEGTEIDRSNTTIVPRLEKLEFRYARFRYACLPVTDSLLNVVASACTQQRFRSRVARRDRDFSREDTQTLGSKIYNSQFTSRGRNFRDRREGNFTEARGLHHAVSKERNDRKAEQKVRSTRQDFLCI